MRRALLLSTGLLVAALVSGCTVPRPPGAGALRYRDEVFSQLTKTPTSSTARRPTWRAIRSP